MMIYFFAMWGALLFLLNPAESTPQIGVFLMLMLIVLKVFLAKTHVLALLLSLELMMILSLFSVLLFFQLISTTTLMMIFTLAVCEASFGLGLLIKFARAQNSFGFSFSLW